MAAIRRSRGIGVFGPVIGLAVSWVLFASLAGATFVSWDNTKLMLLQTAVIGTAAVGATMIVISRGIDLSVGSSIALGTVVIALVLKAGAPVWVGAIAGVACGALCGWVIGGAVTGHAVEMGALAAGVLAGWWAYEKTGGTLWLGRIFWIGGAATVGCGALVVVMRLGVKRPELPPFIVTLGMWGALRGVAKGLGDNQPVYPPSTGWLGDVMSTTGGMLGLPWGVWVLAAVAVVASVVLRATVFGRRVYAIGSNEHAARICGVPVERTKIWIYAAGVGCAGLASVLQFSYLSMGDPTTADGYELRIIAAVVIGGASLSGGEGGVWGTLVGALLMTVVDNGCTKLGVDNWVQEIITGAIIVAAVVLDRVRRESSDK